MDYNLSYIGYNYYEHERSAIHRPTGSGDYLFLFFPTPVHIVLEGEVVITKPNAIIIYSPEYPQHYSNPKDGFMNDWFHMSSDTFHDIAHSLGLPFNEIFYLEQDAFIREFIYKLELEYKMKEMAYEAFVNAQLTAFFIALARAYHIHDNYRVNPYLAGVKEQFRSLRSQVLTNYQQPWTIEEMADMVKMSRSRFCVLYKEFFGISPKNDLITERFNMAKHLLLTTQLSIEEVSSKVGYSNYYHFNKQFKKTFAQPPGRFRQ